MKPASEEQMREDFEAWCMNHGHSLSKWPINGDYQFAATESAWRAWQAAAAMYDRKAREECAAYIDVSLKPDWKDAPKWAQWLAQDEDGAWWWYEGQPIAFNNGWCPIKGADGDVQLAQVKNWRETLEARPDA